MPQPARPRTDAASHRAPSAQRVQIVSHLDEESGDRFYTGFPGEVGGGLFVERVTCSGRMQQSTSSPIRT